MEMGLSEKGSEVIFTSFSHNTLNATRLPAETRGSVSRARVCFVLFCCFSRCLCRFLAAVKQLITYQIHVL